MFWSKIWFFLVSAVAAVALTLAMVMPRPAERATVNTEQKQLRAACSVAGILMRDFARTRVQLAADTARDESGLDAVLATSSKGEIVSGEAYSSAKKILTSLDFGMTRKGEEDVPYRPDMVVALDLAGRVVARSGKDENIYGDSLAGYFLIDDALSGYQRDDLWLFGGQIISVAAAPVILTRTLEYAGAVVIGEAIDQEFTTDLAKRLGVQLSFYANGEAVATSEQVGIDKEVIARAAELAGKPPGTDCTALEPLAVSSADKSYWVLPARLPGEAGMLGAFYAVHIPQAKEIGFSGTISAVKKDDLSFSRFPWLKVAILFLVMVGVGIFFTIWENDRPLRRLSKDSVALAKGESERLAEEKYRGKFGSVARSVNIGIDKLHREARAAKKDLDNLLGPMPEGAAPSPSAIIAAVAPPADLGFAAPVSPPPPSAFRFSEGAGIGVAPGSLDLGIPAPPTDDRIPPPPVALPPVASAGKKPAAAPSRPKPPVPAGAPPRRATPPPMAAVSAPGGTQPLSIDDDILGGGVAAGGRGKPATRSVPIAHDDEDEETRVSGRNSPDEAPTVAGGPAPVSAVMGGAGEREDEKQFRSIYDEFLTLKKKCGEPVDNLTYDRFLAKLRSNRDALIAKHGCKAVKFQVYVKDGKAALKASPIR